VAEPTPARPVRSHPLADLGVAQQVIEDGHPRVFVPSLGTSGGFIRGAGRLDISSRALRGSPDLLCRLRSSTRIECDDRVNVSRVKKAFDDWINQTAQTVEVNVPEVSKLGNALAGRPKWVAGRPHRETRGRAW
jgi:hypothetical protein